VGAVGRAELVQGIKEYEERLLGRGGLEQLLEVVGEVGELDGNGVEGLVVVVADLVAQVGE